MNATAEHPVLATFDNLLALRTFVLNDPNDVGASFLCFCSANFTRSRAQLFQDLFVVFVLKGKRDGFFVEFGATNGLDLSNTAILEKDFQWKGLLAEPAKCWHAALKSNRSAALDQRCVWSKSGETLSFKETEIPELSTLATLVDADFNRGGRVNGKVYTVETVSLNDLLKFHNCPRQIDYLSIDTEGSELEILRAFKFDDYDIGVVSVEHNYREPDRQAILDLLTQNGFIRVFEALSKYDDWYVKRAIAGI